MEGQKALRETYVVFKAKDSKIFRAPPSDADKEQLRVMASMVAEHIINSDGLGFSLTHFVQELESQLKKSPKHPQNKILVCPDGHFGDRLSFLYINWDTSKVLCEKRLEDVRNHHLCYDREILASKMPAFGQFLLDKGYPNPKSKTPEELGCEYVFKSNQAEIEWVSPLMEWEIEEGPNEHGEILSPIYSYCSCCP